MGEEGVGDLDREHDRAGEHATEELEEQAVPNGEKATCLDHISQHRHVALLIHGIGLLLGDLAAFKLRLVGLPRDFDPSRRVQKLRRAEAAAAGQTYDGQPGQLVASAQPAASTIGGGGVPCRRSRARQPRSMRR